MTSGLDFGLRLVTTLVGEDVAKIQQLAMQYDPQPPYDVGVPAKAGPELLNPAALHNPDLWIPRPAWWGLHGALSAITGIEREVGERFGEPLDPGFNGVFRDGAKTQ